MTFSIAPSIIMLSREGVLAVGYRGELEVHAFGLQTFDSSSPAITRGTIYDAASLTKAVATTTLISMQVSEDERLAP